MPTRQSIKAIHTAKTRAGLTDAAYRAALARVGERHGQSYRSSLEIPQNLVGDVLDEIKASDEQEKKRGWKPAQIATAKKYQRMANLDDADLRIIIREVSGQMNENSPKLTPYHFERTMVRLELRMDEAVARGESEWPADVQPCYWRHTRQAGAMSSRQSWQIRQLWDSLSPLLPPDARHPEYLRGVACKAAGRNVRDVWALPSWQAANLIDALRDMIAQHQRPHS